MAIEYYKVLDVLGIPAFIKGRGSSSARRFEEATGNKVMRDWDSLSIDFSNALAIIAVDESSLWNSTQEAIKLGFRKILIEKPGASSIEELVDFSSVAPRGIDRCYVAYNRRYYANVSKVRHFIEDDGGISSVFFDFSERSNVIEPLLKNAGVKENWFIHNSSHVIDTVISLCGALTLTSSQRQGGLIWHSKGSKFSGIGKLDSNGAPFVYVADWEAPANWEITINTKQRRMTLKPLEKLTVVRKDGSVEIHDEFLASQGLKPGLKAMVEDFLKPEPSNLLLTLRGQLKNVDTYRAILEAKM
jgi:predicted dehydrogenase